jgi:hypothetical protein
VRNSEVVITLALKEGTIHTFAKGTKGWFQHVGSTDRTHEMTAEQVLSHLLPALVGHSFGYRGATLTFERKRDGG